MKLRHIEVFHAVYYTGSMTRAAEMLLVSQPAISKILHHAEQQLGFPLFHRVKGNRLVATADARVLIKDVDVMYQQLSSLRKTAENLRDNIDGHISLSAVPALSLDLIPSAIQTFRTNFPSVTFDVHTKHYEDTVRALLQREIDLGLVFNPQPHPGIKEVEIGQAELMCIAPVDRFVDQQCIALEQIRDLDLISISESGPLGNLLTRELGEDYFLNSPVKAQTYHLARSLVARGLGVAIVDELTARASFGAEIRVLSIEPGIEFRVTALYLEDQPLAKVSSDFLKTLKREYGNS